MSDIDKFEEKELTKKRMFAKNTWYDWYNWLLNYIPKLIKKSVSGVKLKNENEPIKGRIIRDIKTFFQEEEDYDKLARVGNFCRNNYIEYESNGDKNKTLWIKENFDKIKPYLKNIINDF